MKLADHLSKDDIRKFNQLRNAQRKKKEHRHKRNKEKESVREIENLMGTHMYIY